MKQKTSSRIPALRRVGQRCKEVRTTGSVRNCVKCKLDMPPSMVFVHFESFRMETGDKTLAWRVCGWEHLNGCPI